MKLTLELLSNLLGVEVTDSENILNEYAEMEVENIEVIKNNVVFTVSKNGKSFENKVFGGSQMCVEIENNDVYNVTDYKKTYSLDELKDVEEAETVEEVEEIVSEETKTEEVEEYKEENVDTYRIYIYNKKDDVYHYQGTKKGNMEDVLSYCIERYSEYGGYIKDSSDINIVKRF